MINVYKPDNEAEANAIKMILEENNIDAKVTSFHDTAYDGLYQSQYGWGVIKVSEENFSKAQEIITEWKNSAPAEIPWKKNE
jgi:hypothetical protein